MAKYLSCAETSVMMRKALKEAFPGIKFSVKSKVYSGGASITASWQDGPNGNQVEAVTSCFSGASFDGMIDLKSYTSSMIDGQEVRFGADFVFTRREFSLPQIQKACDAAARYWGFAPVLAADYKSGALWSVFVPGFSRNVQELVSEKLYKMSDRMAVGKSATANKVIYLGGDGAGCQVAVEDAAA
jgi:hypothetical protein